MKYLTPSPYNKCYMQHLLHVKSVAFPFAVNQTHPQNDKARIIFTAISEAMKPINKNLAFSVSYLFEGNRRRRQHLIGF